MRFHVLESGSKGNCTIVVSNSTIIAIDNGLSKKSFKKKLAELSISIDDIRATLVTHGHQDHIGGLSVFSPSILYSSQTTFNEIKRREIYNDDFQILNSHLIKSFVPFKINDLEITPIPTSHDIKGSFGFIIKNQDETLVYITDTGFIYEKILTMIQNADYYIMESNHDVRMLLNTNRPQSLKDRILGDKGHMSNEDSALYLSEVIGPKTKEIIFAHLSEEANTKETCLNAFLRIMEKRGVSLENILFRCADQNETVSGGDVLKETVNA